MLKKRSLPILTKYDKNPIILANPENAWEAWQIFNPGVILLDNKVHFFYRAIGPDGISRLGYAVSSDGFTITERLNYPVYEHQLNEGVFSGYSSGGSIGGAEDARMIRVNTEDILYMMYTACDGGLRVALTSIKITDFLNRNWKWKKPALISPLGETHKNWLLFPEKINGQYAILHSIKPKIQIDYFDNLDFDTSNYIKSCYDNSTQTNCWDKWHRGACAPPLKTKRGWLLLYHAMDDDWGKYKVGAMLLDFNDPTKVLFRSKRPVLEPLENYENNGYKPGVVYVTGAIIKGDVLLIYYGAADSSVCVASAAIDDFLVALETI